MKKIFLLAMAFLSGLTGVQKLSAATELYAVLSSDKKTVTFYYDGNRSSRGGTVNWQNDLYASNKSTITTVTFTTSVQDARPTTGYHFFYNLYKLTTINNLGYLKTGNMTSMEGMFYNCAELTSIYLSTSFGTTNATTMKDMFNNCRKLESLDLSIFNTDKVTTMEGMFYDCWALKTIKLPYGFANNVKSMRSMFYSCKTLTTIKVDTHFYTWDVTDMGYMFYGCEKLDMSELVKDFNTRYVTDMDHMFWNCKALKSLNLKGWNMEKVTDTGSMFSGCSNLTTIYRNDNWSKLAITTGGSMFSGCTSLKGGKGNSYNSSKTGLDMAHPDNDGVPGYFTGEETSNNQLYGVVIGTTFNIRYDKEQTLRTGLTNITDLSADEADKVTTVKIESAVKDAKITSTKMWFCMMPNLTTIEGLENINWSNVTDASYLFAEDTKLKSMDLRNINLTGKKCDNMFQNCSALTTIYCDENYTSSLKSATNMFYGCTSLKGQRGTTYSFSHADESYARPDGGTTAPGYFTGKLKEFYGVLGSDGTTLTIYYDDQCDSRSGDIYWYSTNGSKYRDKVTKVVFDATMDTYHPAAITRWFSDYTILKEIVDIKYLHTDQVTDMTETFANCYALENIDLSYFQTTKVTSMESLFMGCKALTQIDVNNFFDFADDAVNAIESTALMFAYCDNLKTIYCNNDWTKLGVTSSNNMFYESKKLIGGKNVRYDEEHTDISYARPAEGLKTPGYFTRKQTAIDYQMVNGKCENGKFIENGQLLISRDGQLYNALGTRVE